MGVKKTKKKKEKISVSKLIGKIILLSVGFMSGILIATVLEKYDVNITSHTTYISLAVFLFAVYISFFINVIIHEAGHLVFGLLSGYRFGSFRIASFMFICEDGKIRLRRHSLVGTGGQCLMVPPDMKDGKLPVTLYNLGGCIMNTLFAVLFLLLYFITSDISGIAPFILIFSIVGFMCAAENGIPMHIAGIDNDGYNAFAIRKSTDAMYGFWVQLKAVEQISKGFRLKDMPDEWFDVPSDESMKNSMVATRGVLVCNRLMDAESFGEADALMAHMLSLKSGMVGVHRNLLICDRIYIELVTENRQDVINAMLTQELRRFMKAMKNNPTVIRTE